MIAPLHTIDVTSLPHKKKLIGKYCTTLIYFNLFTAINKVYNFVLSVEVFIEFALRKRNNLQILHFGKSSKIEQ